MRASDRLASLFTIIILFAPHGVQAQKYEGNNWCENAEKYLTKKDKKPDCEKISASDGRCPMMNNYWCITQNSANPWKGTPDAHGKDGNNDKVHAIFSDPVWAARAVAIDLSSKYKKKKLHSASQIANEYSPACDTLGTKVSVKTKNGEVGRSCKNDPYGTPPPDFKGKLCPEAPKTKEDCLPQCNCPIEIRDRIVKGTGLGPDDDLKLFNEAGEPQPTLNIAIKNLAFQEINFDVSDQLIEDGIKMAFPSK